MKRQWYQAVKNKIAQRCVCSRAGMTLTEMLAAVLILAMSAVAVAGGVAAVKNAYRKTTEKAEAQQVLATTVELITDVLSEAQQVRSGGDCGPEFFSGETGDWMRLSVMPYQAAGGAQASNGAQVSNEDQISNEDRAGICKEYLSDGTRVPLLSDGAMGGLFCTSFDVDQYRYADSCFILEDINVYYKRDVANADRKPAAHLDKLVVRAVNLEGQDE